MLQSILTLHVDDDQLADLVKEYKSKEIIERAMPFGLITGEAIRTPSKPGTMIITSLWPSMREYQAWLDSSERADANDGMASLLKTGGTSDIATVNVPDVAVGETPHIRYPFLDEGAEVDRLHVVSPQNAV